MTPELTISMIEVTMTTTRTPTAIVAVGGNSLIADSQHQKVEDQWDAVRTTAMHIAGMIERGGT